MPESSQPILVQSTKNYAIIVAGGSGTRMQSAVPKQFMLLNGRPVLMHTIEAFASADSNPQIIVVLPVSFHAYWEQTVLKHSFDIPHKVISGGQTRFNSVKNAVDSIPDDGHAIVAVHDAVRPLASRLIIDQSYITAAELGNAVTAVKSRDSIRQVKNNISKSIVREEIYLVQTPQTFTLGLLKQAYNQDFELRFTDDASVVENTGAVIHLIDGSYENIKITFPGDIMIAEALIKKVHS